MLSMLFLAISAPDNLYAAAPKKDQIDDQHDSNLITAVRQNDLDTVKTILQNGADINFQNINGATALMIATQNGNATIVHELIARGANVNIQSNHHGTALMAAAKNSNTAIVHELLAHGAHVNIQSIDNTTALMIAAGEGHLAIVHELIARGSNVNLQNTKGLTALMIAVSKGHVAIAQELIGRRAYINLQTASGTTALMFATQKNNLAIVQELIAHGADINFKNSNGLTALMLAAQNGHLPILEELITHGADVNLQAYKGTTALIIAAANSHLPIVQELITHGANVNLKDVKGATALTAAASNRHAPIMQELIKHHTPGEIIKIIADIYTTLKRDISGILAKAGFVIPIEARELVFSETPDRSKEVCAICLAPLYDSETATDQETALLECHHETHKKCLTPWLELSRKCPECRAAITFIPDSQEQIDIYFRAITTRIKNNPFIILPANTSEPRSDFEKAFFFLPLYQREQLRTFQKALIQNVITFFEQPAAEPIVNNPAIVQPSAVAQGYSVTSPAAAGHFCPSGLHDYREVACGCTSADAEIETEAEAEVETKKKISKKRKNRDEE